MQGERFQALGSTVRGPRHAANGKPNQDALMCTRKASGKAIILALADGLGSHRCVHSDRGARLAVQAAQMVMQPFVNQLKPKTLIQAHSDMKEQIPRQIVSLWRRSVTADFMCLASKAEESERKELNEYQKNGLPESGRNPAILYGTTLLVAFNSPLACGFLQIGDGDLLVVDEKMRVQRPLAKDARCLGEETPSLCREEAWMDFRCGFFLRHELDPQLIMAATDGYGKSFCDEAALLKAPLDWLKVIEEEGLEVIRGLALSWLEEHSAKSGDDVSLGLIIKENSDPERCEKQVDGLNEVAHESAGG